jgi:hypothetical protein
MAFADVSQHVDFQTGRGGWWYVVVALFNGLLRI